MIGINKNVEKIYKILKYKIGILDHYYYLNPKIKFFEIASVNKNHKKISPDVLSSQKIEVITSLSEIKLVIDATYRPIKSIEYFIRRYEEHPFYNYKFLVIKNNNQNTCILVVRKIQVGHSSCIRIIDVLGDLSKVGNIESELNVLLDKEEAEYVDFLNHGITEDIFYQMGFLLNKGEVVIPNYFEPFLQSNTEIQFAYKSNYENYVIFKGDSDQDRPNIISNE